jgi:hypothetical protein
MCQRAALLEQYDVVKMPTLLVFKVSQTLQLLCGGV